MDATIRDQSKRTEFVKTQTLSGVIVVIDTHPFYRARLLLLGVGPHHVCQKPLPITCHVDARAMLQLHCSVARLRGEMQCDAFIAGCVVQRVWHTL